MGSIQRGGKNNPYNVNFNNDSNDIPSRKNGNSRLRYEKTEYLHYSIQLMLTVSLIDIHDIYISKDKLYIILRNK